MLFSTECLKKFEYDSQIEHDYNFFYSQVKITETIKCFEMTKSKSQMEEMEMNGVYLIEVDGKLKGRVQRTVNSTSNPTKVRIWKQSLCLANLKKKSIESEQKIRLIYS